MVQRVTTQQVGNPRSLEPTVLSGDRVMVGDLTLDLPNRTISGRGTLDRDLSRNEFALLATLIKSAGRLVLRQDLMAAINLESDDSSIIDTYVKYLRGLLVDVHSSVTIDRSGFGFALRP